MYQQTEQRDAGRAGADYATLWHTTHPCARTQPLEHSIEPRPNFCTYALYFYRSLYTCSETNTGCSCDYGYHKSTALKSMIAVSPFASNCPQSQAVSVSKSESTCNIPFSNDNSPKFLINAYGVSLR